jgi:hypothetical protein
MDRFIKYIFLMGIMMTGESCAASVQARVQQYSNDIQNRYTALRDPRVRWGICLTGLTLSAMLLKHMLTTVSNVKEIICDGSGSKTIACIRQQMEEVRIILSGNFTLNVGSIAAKKLTIEQSGNSTLCIGSGKILKGNLTLKGNGTFEAARLKVKDLIMHISGNATATCAPEGSVSGLLSGNSAFINFGNAHTGALQQTGLAVCRRASFFEALFSPMRHWLW